MSTEPRAPQVGSIERRSAHTGRLEARGSGGVRRIGGIGIPVGVTATIGGGNFTEEVDPGALDDVLGWDIRCLLNHQPDQLLGRTTSKTLQLKKTSAGLDYTCALPETRADVWESVQRGDLTGSSWRFTVAKDEWTRGASGVPHRRILRFASVLDVGPVTYEAYVGGATVSARCVERVAELAGAEVRFVPPNISISIDRDRAATWSAPTLLDFTDSNWADLSVAERKRIAGYFAYSASWPPEKFGDLKLPHHDPKSGRVIWRALVNAAARLGQADIPAGEVDGVKAHLAKHFAAFGARAPWERSAGSGGSREETRRLKRQVEADIAAARREEHALDMRIAADVEQENEREIARLDARLASGRAGPGVTGRERRLSAFHEAGHALAVVLEGGHVTELTLTSCRHEFPRGHRHRGALLHVLGQAAENLYAGEPGRLPGRSSTDWQQAAGKLRALGLDADAWIPRELRYGESVARFYWEPIEALAELLYRKGRVSGREAEGVLSRAIADQTQRRVFSGESPRWGPLLPPSMRAVK